MPAFNDATSAHAENYHVQLLEHRHFIYREKSASQVEILLLHRTFDTILGPLDIGH
jgi:hypothetical protein